MCSFPSWLDPYFPAWVVPLANDTAVLHFRSGDTFDTALPPHPAYAQPVCRHYLEAFRHSGAACALLVAESDLNPCVAVAAARLPCVRRPPPDCTAGCAFTLLARSRILIASVSTFANTAAEAFAVPGGRRFYRPYCSECPVRRGAVMQLCTHSDRAGIFPWKAMPAQVALLESRPARVVECGGLPEATGPAEAG